MPSTVYLVTGGARSGKSSYAQTLCERLCSHPVYLATSNPQWDDGDFKDRVERHKKERGENWTTIEETLKPSAAIESQLLNGGGGGGRVILLDCVTLWLTNYFMEEGAFSITSTTATENKDEKRNPNEVTETIVTKMKEEFNTMTKPWNLTFVVVTNELGSGTHASTIMSRKFVDAQGWMNQYIAQRATKVIHMVCGIPNVIKDTSKHDPRDTVASSTSEEKRQEAIMVDKFLSARKMPMDEKGYFMIKLDRTKCVIVVSFYSCILNDKGEVCDLQGNKIKCCGDEGKKSRPEPMKIWECRTAKEITSEIFERWATTKAIDGGGKEVGLTVGHAAYIGREAQKAEDALYSGKYYQQD